MQDALLAWREEFLGSLADDLALLAQLAAIRFAAIGDGFDRRRELARPLRAFLDGVDGAQELAALFALAAQHLVPGVGRHPFETGAARRWPPQELVRYTFAAVQAWARERDLGRQAGETALEFVRRVGDEVPALEAELLRIADLYGRAAYARGGLPANTAELLRQFWARLERVVAQPLSA